MELRTNWFSAIIKTPFWWQLLLIHRQLSSASRDPRIRSIIHPCPKYTHCFSTWLIWRETNCDRTMWHFVSYYIQCNLLILTTRLVSRRNEKIFNFKGCLMLHILAFYGLLKKSERCNAIIQTYKTGHLCQGINALN